MYLAIRTISKATTQLVFHYLCFFLHVLGLDAVSNVLPLTISNYMPVEIILKSNEIKVFLMTNLLIRFAHEHPNTVLYISCTSFMKLIACILRRHLKENR